MQKSDSVGERSESENRASKTKQSCEADFHPKDERREARPLSISVEISLYPLDNNYIPPIQDFIDRLNSYSKLKVIENTMSTQVYGEYSEVLAIVNKEMQRTHQTTPKAAFVLKVLYGDLSPDV